ncbi:hypothetical protein GCM10009564_20610 [Streptomyces thermogriseus]|uniref:Uncharacterized protein n=1 Tax=Streptomyces thermogriseus TaxID=75292 RepID=A0ABN1SXZ1_9ACTN
MQPIRLRGTIDEELKQTGRWRPGFRVFRAVHVRPAQTEAERDVLYARIPVHNPAAIGTLSSKVPTRGFETTG